MDTSTDTETKMIEDIKEVLSTSEIVQALDKKEIPECMPDEYRYFFKERTLGKPLDMEGFYVKEACRNRGMYAFVSKEWTEPFAKWIGKRKVLEVMSGAGWLAKALSEQGVDVMATDNYSWINKNNWDVIHPVGRAKAVRAIREMGADMDILLISWPYMDNQAYYAIKNWDALNPGKLIVYIGEFGEGCTANKLFFDHVEIIESKKFSKAVENYKSWWGIHDSVYLLKYKI